MYIYRLISTCIYIYIQVSISNIYAFSNLGPISPLKDPFKGQQRGMYTSPRCVPRVLRGQLQALRRNGGIEDLNLLRLVGHLH